jgi:predicted  nucleic acid-binding Zn-ribbon protein
LLTLESKQQQIVQLQQSFDLQTQSIALEKQKLLQEIELFKSSTKNEIANEYVELQKQKRDLSLNDLELQ